MQLGFGATGAWAARWFNEDKAERVLAAALEAGITHFDTAGFYAGGLAEERLARCLGRLGALGRPGIVVSTKIGKRITEDGRLARDFSGDAIKNAVDRHIGLFGGQPPDIVYMHGPDEHERHSCLPILLDLASQGAIGAIGDCSDGDHLMASARCDAVNVLMGRYHFLNPENKQAFRVAKAANKKIVSIAPLAQGLWRRGFLRPRRPSDVWYLARALIRNRDALRRARMAKWIQNVDGWPPSHLAFAYVRQNTDIDVVLTTSTQAEHIRDAATGFSRPVPPDIVEIIERNTSITD